MKRDLTYVLSPQFFPPVLDMPLEDQVLYVPHPKAM